jgi:hypothetical protein
MAKGLIKFSAEIKHRTERAFLLSDGHKHWWLGRQHIVKMCWLYGDTYCFFIPCWVAERKGILASLF